MVRRMTTRFACSTSERGPLEKGRQDGSGLVDWKTHALILRQRGGQGNLHHDKEDGQAHKGLADKLKDKMFKKKEGREKE